MEEKESEISLLFNEKESTRLKLGAKNDMFEHFENKSQEYIKRIRSENKGLK